MIGQKLVIPDGFMLQMILVPFWPFLFPICLMIAIKRTLKLSSIYHWVPVLLTAFSLLMLGTKVGYGALLIGLLAAVVTCWISWFRKRDKMVPYKWDHFCCVIFRIDSHYSFYSYLYKYFCTYAIIGD